MKTSVLAIQDTDHLDYHFLKDGLLVPQKAEHYDNIDLETLRIWCHKHGFYSLPTIEAVEFIRRLIDGQRTIEIGAGHGAWGRALNIKLTDSKLQDRPEIKAAYEAMRQPTINYPKDVVKLDAHKAIKKYNPRVVLGSWITPKYKEGDKNGNMFGPEELKFLDAGRTYIHIGNKQTHDNKKIFKYLKEEYFSPSLFSRSADQSDNVIWVFKK